MSVQTFTIADIRNLIDPKNDPSVKKYLKYDSGGDVTDIYYAQAEAASGVDCLQQQFVYATVSGNKNMIKTSWTNATWGGASWDI